MTIAYSQKIYPSVSILLPFTCEWRKLDTGEVLYTPYEAGTDSQELNLQAMNLVLRSLVLTVAKRRTVGGGFGLTSLIQLTCD